MKISVFILSVFLLSSCAAVYIPNARNAPMLSKKGEFQTSATVDPFINVNTQTAYAVSNHVGVMANGLYVHTSDNENEYKNQHLYGEVGAGYFYNYKNFYFDAWGGYGIGKTKAIDWGSFFDASGTSTWSVTYQGMYEKYFIQPGFAIKRKNLHYGFVHRFSLLNFSGVSGLDENKEAISFIKTNQFFYEPSFVFKVFIKQFYFTTQAGFSLPLGKTDNNLNFMPFQFSVGVGVRLNFIKEK